MSNKLNGFAFLALALLFDNVSAAQGKGDIAINGEEFEIKGYNAKTVTITSNFINRVPQLVLVHLAFSVIQF